MKNREGEERDRGPVEDKTEVWEREIEPKMTEVYELCDKYGIPLVSMAQISPEAHRFSTVAMRDEAHMLLQMAYGLCNYMPEILMPGLPGWLMECKSRTDEGTQPIRLHTDTEPPMDPRLN